MLPAEMTMDPIMIAGFAQATLSVSSTGAQTAALNEGIYVVWCDEANVYIKLHASTASNVTTSTGYPVMMGNVEIVYVPASHVLGGITASVAGTLRYHRVR